MRTTCTLLYPVPLRVSYLTPQFAAFRPYPNLPRHIFIASPAPATRRTFAAQLRYPPAHSLSPVFHCRPAIPVIPLRTGPSLSVFGVASMFMGSLWSLLHHLGVGVVCGYLGLTTSSLTRTHLGCVPCFPSGPHVALAHVAIVVQNFLKTWRPDLADRQLFDLVTITGGINNQLPAGAGFMIVRTTFRLRPT